jgi:hypothetical protein
MTEPTAADIAQALTVASPAVVRLVADMLTQLGLMRREPVRRERAKHVPRLQPRVIDPERARVLEAELARRGVG